MKYPISIELTIAQHRLFGREIRQGLDLGDCKLRGFRLEMGDYEGARAMADLFAKRDHDSRRDFMSWYSVVDRLDSAIAKAGGRA